METPIIPLKKVKESDINNYVVNEEEGMISTRVSREQYGMLYKHVVVT